MEIAFQVDGQTFILRWKAGEPLRAGYVLQSWRSQGLIDHATVSAVFSRIVTLEENQLAQVARRKAS
jgi:hypothetical protein